MLDRFFGCLQAKINQLCVLMSLGLSDPSP